MGWSNESCSRPNDACTRTNSSTNTNAGTNSSTSAGTSINSCTGTNTSTNSCTGTNTSTNSCTNTSAGTNSCTNTSANTSTNASSNKGGHISCMRREGLSFCVHAQGWSLLVRVPETRVYSRNPDIFVDLAASLVGSSFGILHANGRLTC